MRKTSRACAPMEGEAGRTEPAVARPKRLRLAGRGSWAGPAARGRVTGCVRTRLRVAGGAVWARLAAAAALVRAAGRWLPRVAARARCGVGREVCCR